MLLHGGAWYVSTIINCTSLEVQLRLHEHVEVLLTSQLRIFQTIEALAW